MKFVVLLILIFMSLQNLKASEVEDNSAAAVTLSTKQKELNLDLSKYFLEQKISDRSCLECPQYIKLIEVLNEVLDKDNKNDSISLNNEKKIQLSNLKFLYFKSRAEVEGKIKCSQSDFVDSKVESNLKNGKLKLLAEKALAITNVNDVQFFDSTSKEVHYFYREDGFDQNTIVEIIMKADKTAVIRYYQPVTENKEFSNPKVFPESKKLILPLGIEMSHTIDSGVGGHKGHVSIEDSKGDQFLVLEGENSDSGTKKGSAIVNLNFGIDDSSGLKMVSSLGTNLETKDIFKDGISHKENLVLGLTDHNNEYFKVKALISVSGYDGLEFSNKFKLGDGGIGSEMQIGSDGKKSVGINLTDHGAMDKFSVKYTTVDYGPNKYTASVGTKWGKDTILSTDFSTTSKGDSSFALNFEKNISETTSMVLTVSNGGGTGTAILYQFQAKF